MITVTEAAVAGLPVPVQRSLRRSGVVGQPVPQSVTVRQDGQIRTNAEAKWLRFKARESYTIDPPAFTWKAALKIGGITLGRATDTLDAGRGRMHVRLLGLKDIVDATGPDMDQGSVMRWFNETMWFPAVWATDLIRWESIDDTSAVGSMTAGDQTVEAEFRFDAEGRLVDFRADRAYDADNGFEVRPWRTPITGHAGFNGIELPAGGSAVWELDDGDFEYIQIRVTDVRYDG
ncbi:MAG: hypothetical protein QNJ89_03615 [Acidimicrobiia bacterium]|nr:hypothetical protein [Acidimicrobiia bacterium]